MNFNFYSESQGIIPSLMAGRDPSPHPQELRGKREGFLREPSGSKVVLDAHPKPPMLLGGGHPKGGAPNRSSALPLTPLQSSE